MSHTNLELLTQYAVGHVMEVIIVRRPIVSKMASSRLKETHYEVVVTEVAKATDDPNRALIYNVKKKIKSIDQLKTMEELWQVQFDDGTKLEHPISARSILQLVHEDPDDL